MLLPPLSRPFREVQVARLMKARLKCSFLLSFCSPSLPNPVKLEDRHATAAAAKSLQLCPTLCDPIDGSPSSSPIRGILQERTLEWVAISFSNAGKWKDMNSNKVCLYDIQDRVSCFTITSWSQELMKSLAMFWDLKLNTVESFFTLIKSIAKGCLW